jgi:hypothetical protein
MAMSDSSGSVYPDVCPHCGSILLGFPPAAQPPDDSDLISSSATSDLAVCRHCGQTLSAPRTTPPPHDADSASPFPSGSREPRPEIAPLSLILVESRQRISLPAIYLVYLGRRDEQHNIHPDIDFTPDGGEAYGVSRQHARIHQSKDGVFIEDLNSTNGTFLNGQRLIPSKLYPLEHGDMLRLGHLGLAVAFLGEQTAHDT